MWATEILRPVRVSSQNDVYTKSWPDERGMTPGDWGLPMSVGYVDLPYIGRCHVHIQDYLIVNQSGDVMAVLDGNDWSISRLRTPDTDVANA